MEIQVHHQDSSERIMIVTDPTGTDHGRSMVDIEVDMVIMIRMAMATVTVSIKTTIKDIPEIQEVFISSRINQNILLKSDVNNLLCCCSI